LYITTITLAGLLFGIQALPQGKRRDQLDSVLNDLLVLFQDRVRPFDANAARHYAPLAVSADRGSLRRHLGTSEPSWLMPRPFLDRPEFHRHSFAALRVALFELYR